ncbi:hypothetical protein V6N13_147744 [Hibiscus sabdariffa]
MVALLSKSWLIVFIYCFVLPIVDKRCCSKLICIEKTHTALYCNRMDMESCVSEFGGCPNVTDHCVRSTIVESGEEKFEIDFPFLCTYALIASGMMLL